MAVNPMMNSPRLDGVLNTGLKGMSAGVNGMKQAASEIAEFNVADAGARVSAPSHDDMIDALTSLKIYQRQVEASARVVETADEVLGFLLDVHA